MKFKLDENLGGRTLGLLRESGHDVQTVRHEGLGGSSDQVLFEYCRQEHRCLVTLDLDFADVMRFPPHLSSGIAVIRVPKNPGLALLHGLIRGMLDALAVHSLEGSLWIVEPGRVRIHEPEDR